MLPFLFYVHLFLSRGLEENDGRGNRGIERIDCPAHGDFYRFIGGGEPGFAQTLVLAADNDSRGTGKIRSGIDFFRPRSSGENFYFFPFEPANSLA